MFNKINGLNYARGAILFPQNIDIITAISQRLPNSFHDRNQKSARIKVIWQGNTYTSVTSWPDHSRLFACFNGYAWFSADSWFLDGTGGFTDFITGFSNCAPLAPTIFSLVCEKTKE